MEIYIALGLILICLIVLGIIIIPKFSLLSNVDVDNIQSEQEERIKQRILSNKLHRELAEAGRKISKFFRPAGKQFSKLFGSWLTKLHQARENYKSKKAIMSEDVKQRLEVLFLEAIDLVKQDNLGEAEKKYIEIIGLDSRNAKAFSELGEIYLDKQSYQEAQQTFEHVVKLKTRQALEPGDSGNQEALGEIYFSLANAYQLGNDSFKAMINLKKALKCEPNNPRFIDRKIELSIIKKDKVEALEAYKKLAETNPENQKLAEFKAKIDEL